MLRSEKTRTTRDNDFRMSSSVEGRRRLESGASVTVERFVGRSQSLTAGATGELYINRGASAWPMAKRKYTATKRNKIEPSVQTFTMVTPSTPGGTVGQYTVDLSQIASIVNRRFYRQGINWAVGGVKIFSTVPAELVLSKLHNTWITSNAWEKAFRMWNKQQMEAIADAGGESAVAAFRDFKVHMDVQHVADGFGANLLPIDASANAAQFGEWQQSLILLPNTIAGGIAPQPTELLLHMNGPNTNPGISRGIIEGYADSRAFPQSPDPVSPNISDADNWMARMFDVGNDFSEVLDNATNRNDDLPYDQVDYPGGENNLPGLQIHDQSTITGTTIGGTTRFKGGNFPCGLMRFTHAPVGESASLLIQVDLIPGTHRGYLCEPMTDM